MIETKRKVNKGLHKSALWIVILILITTSSPIVCRAEEETEASVNVNIDGILDDFESIIPDGSDVNADVKNISESLGIKRILTQMIETVKGESTELTSFLASLLGVCLLSAIASQYDGELSLFASRSVLAVFSVMTLDKMIFLLNGAVDSLGEINAFYEAVIPVTVAVNSLGVTPTTASTQALGMGLTLGVYSFLATELIAPIVGVIFICSAACSLDSVFERLSLGVRNLFVSTLGILTVLVGAVFSLQSAISSTADSTLVRSARYAISSTIPIVGSTVSGALGVAIGSVSYARGIIGTGAIAVVVLLMLSPLVTLFSYRLCLKVGSAFCSLCSVDGARGVLNTFIGALDALLAVYSLTCIVYVVELAAFLKGGVHVA